MMQRERIELGALLAEIVGAVAVVVSVVYLAMQISDNTSELQSQGHFHALSLAQKPLELLVSDRELANIIETGYSAPEQLSPSDWHRFAMYQTMAFNAWEFLFYANRSGSIPENLWVGAALLGISSFPLGVCPLETIVENHSRTCRMPALWFPAP